MNSSLETHYSNLHNAIMLETTGWIDCDDGAKLFIRRWRPEGGTEAGKPSAHVLVVHGMAEHSQRYGRLAEALCSRGIEVWAADMRGHGKTADVSVNGAEKGGLPGHCADKNGFFRVVEDLRIINKYIAGKTKAEYGELPFFILGHSWGSFLAQAYMENPAAYLPLSGCMLSGTRGPGGAKFAFSLVLLSLISFLKGSRKVSRLAVAFSRVAYNKPFKPNRTPFDWLSRDEKEVDAYKDDPLCGYDCSSGFYRDMAGAITAMNSKKAVAGIDRNLPIYIFCGSADPVGDMGAGPTALVNLFRRQGITNLEFVVYPEARHGTLIETNREEVTEALINWLLRQL